MFVVRPILRHYILWLLLAPLFLAEAYTLQVFLQMFALQDATQTQTVLAQVTDERAGARGPEIRYAFQLPGHSETFHAADVTRLSNVWVPITDAQLQTIQASNNMLEVSYLPASPWTNQAAGQLGHPLGDSFCWWGFFLVIDLLWIAETVVIVRNFLRSQAAAERRTPQRIRFWEVKHGGNPWTA